MPLTIIKVNESEEQRKHQLDVEREQIHTKSVTNFGGEIRD